MVGNRWDENADSARRPAMSDELRCETCRRWGTLIADRMPRRACAAWDHLSKPDDTCEHYEEAVPFTDDAMGSDAELDAKEAGNE